MPWWVIPGGGSCRGARGGVRLWGSVGLGLGGLWVGARTVVDIAGRWMGGCSVYIAIFLGTFFIRLSGVMVTLMPSMVINAVQLLLYRSSFNASISSEFDSRLRQLFAGFCNASGRAGDVS